MPLSPQTSPKTATPRSSRRAFSLVEVVMAGALLTLIASAVVGGITTVVSADSRNQQKLESLELANRLLLQYLDDKGAMPDQEAHVTQGRGVYRWTMHTSPVAISMPRTSLVDKPAEGPGSKAIDKLELLSVSVYAGVPDGMGGFAYGDRVSTLTRVYHPLSVVYRNPDRMIRLGSNTGDIMKWFEELMAERPVSRSGSPIGTPKPLASSDLFTGARANDNRSQ